MSKCSSGKFPRQQRSNHLFFGGAPKLGETALDSGDVPSPEVESFSRVNHKVFLVQHLKSLKFDDSARITSNCPPSLSRKDLNLNKACHFQPGRDLHWFGADVPPWGLSRLGHNL